MANTVSSSFGTKCSKRPGEYCRLHSPAPASFYSAEDVFLKVEQESAASKKIGFDRVVVGDGREVNFSTKGLPKKFDPFNEFVPAKRENEVIYARKSVGGDGSAVLTLAFYQKDATKQEEMVSIAAKSLDRKDLEEAVESYKAKTVSPNLAASYEILEMAKDKNKLNHLFKSRRKVVAIKKALEQLWRTPVDYSAAVDIYEADQSVKYAYPLASASAKASMVNQILIAQRNWNLDEVHQPCDLKQALARLS